MASLASLGEKLMEAKSTLKPHDWTTPLYFCICKEPAPPESWVMACCCAPCTLGTAKTQMDSGNPAPSLFIYNCCCWGQPAANRSWTRVNYGITGDAKKDCQEGCCCCPCSNRQLAQEAKTRGPMKLEAPPTESMHNAGQWKTELFGGAFKDPVEFLGACFCPCCATHHLRTQLQPKWNAGSDERCFDTFCMAPCSLYGQMRTQFELETNKMKDPGEVFQHDVVVACCCYSCAIIRARHHVGDTHGLCCWQWQQA